MKPDCGFFWDYCEFLLGKGADTPEKQIVFGILDNMLKHAPIRKYFDKLSGQVQENNINKWIGIVAENLQVSITVDNDPDRMPYPIPFQFQPCATCPREFEPLALGDHWCNKCNKKIILQ